MAGKVEIKGRVVTEELGAARMWTVHPDRFPYYSAAIYALTPIAIQGLGGMAVDARWRLYYDPALLSEGVTVRGEDGRPVRVKWSVEEAGSVLAHEIEHLLRDHAGRCEAMRGDHVLFNDVGDALINKGLLETAFDVPVRPGARERRTEKVKLPGQPITLSWLAERFGINPNAEWIEETLYAEIARKLEREGGRGQQNRQGQGQPKDSGEQGQGSGGFGQGSSAQQGDDRQGAGSGRSSGQGERQSDGQGEGQRRPAPGQGNCGSCAHGQQMPWEEPLEGDADGESGGVTEAEADLIRNEVARQVLEASQSRGSVPGGMVRWAKERLKPKHDPKKQLQALVKHAIGQVAGNVDYTFTRMSRLQAALPAVKLPGMARPAVRMAIVADTSGSMSDDQLGLALGWAHEAIRGLGYAEGVPVLATDATVQACRRVVSADQIVLCGGGGTDMRRGIEAALKLKPKPQVIVVLTDGWTPWPNEAPRGVKVIVGLIGNGATPEWAKVVQIEQR